MLGCHLLSAFVRGGGQFCLTFREKGSNLGLSAAASLAGKKKSWTEKVTVWSHPSCNSLPHLYFSTSPFLNDEDTRISPWFDSRPAGCFSPSTTSLLPPRHRFLRPSTTRRTHPHQQPSSQRLSNLIPMVPKQRSQRSLSHGFYEHRWCTISAMWQRARLVVS